MQPLNPSTFSPRNNRPPSSRPSSHHKLMDQVSARSSTWHHHQLIEMPSRWRHWKNHIENYLFLVVAGSTFLLWVIIHFYEQSNAMHVLSRFFSSPRSKYSMQRNPAFEFLSRTWASIISFQGRVSPIQLNWTLIRSWRIWSTLTPPQHRSTSRQNLSRHQSKLSNQRQRGRKDLIALW